MVLLEHKQLRKSFNGESSRPAHKSEKLAFELSGLVSDVVTRISCFGAEWINVSCFDL